MNTNTNHLPKYKQNEINIIIDIIKKTLKDKIILEKIILFGSYARGDYIESDLVMEGENYFEYKSDFDLLIILNDYREEKDNFLLREIETNIIKNKNIKTPVGLIMEDISEVNSKLEQNRYFYIDIKKEGIILFDSSNLKLSEVKDLSIEEQNDIKKEDFDLWFNSAGEFLNNYHLFSPNIGAFQLHQSAERFITAYMLVKTGYKPKTHDLEILYDIIKELDLGFEDWFEKNEQKYFELLRKGYVEARYSKNYSISKNELQFLEQKIKKLKDIVYDLCKIIY